MRNAVDFVGAVDAVNVVDAVIVKKENIKCVISKASCYAVCVQVSAIGKVLKGVFVVHVLFVPVLLRLGRCSIIFIIIHTYLDASTTKGTTHLSGEVYTVIGRL